MVTIKDMSPNDAFKLTIEANKDDGDSNINNDVRRNDISFSRLLIFGTIAVSALFCVFKPTMSNSVSFPKSIRSKTSSDLLHDTSRRLSSVLGIKSTNQKAPAIAWLMSFPDSGTTFASLSVQSSTRRTIASNYGNMFMHPNGEIVRDQYASIPIFSDRPNGPFLFSELPMPNKYILTKTHCGGHCTDCFPGRYMKGPNKFWQECHTSARFNPETALKKQGEDPFEYIGYDLALVKKAVHLIRDPFDNIVSRFHHEYKLANIRGNIDFTSKYPYNSDGFHKWCDYLSNKFYKEEEKWYDKWHSNLAESVYKRSEPVTCHSEFYKYIHWHNNAFYVTDTAMNLPNKVLYYEDFAQNMDQTLKEVTDFLEMDLVGKGIDFHYHTYKDYFTQSEREVTISYMKLISSPTTWKSIQRYIGENAQSPK